MDVYGIIGTRQETGKRERLQGQQRGSANGSATVPASRYACNGSFWDNGNSSTWKRRGKLSAPLPLLPGSVTHVMEVDGIMETGKRNGSTAAFLFTSVTPVTHVMEVAGIMVIGTRNGSAANWRLARFPPIWFPVYFRYTCNGSCWDNGNRQYKHGRAAVMSLATVELFIGTRYYSADSDGEDFATDSREQVISCDWEEFQSREEFIEEIANEFRKRGASFAFTGSRTAAAESYQHPYTGVWEELSMCILSGADDALHVAVIREVDKR